MGFRVFCRARYLASFATVGFSPEGSSPCIPHPLHDKALVTCSHLVSLAEAAVPQMFVFLVLD